MLARSTSHVAGALAIDRYSLFMTMSFAGYGGGIDDDQAKVGKALAEQGPSAPHDQR